MTNATYTAKDGFVKREIAGEILLVPVGARTQDFNGMIMLNETGGYLWDLLKEPKTEEQLLTALLGEFDAPKDAAAADLKEFLDTGITNGLIVRQ